MTLQDLTPPPTDPEHAPIKAPINNKNEIENDHLEVSDIPKPVVVKVETVWKATSLIDKLDWTDRALTNKASINIINNIETKNLSSGS